MAETLTRSRTVTNELIRQYGPIEIIEANSGDKITILPTSTAPLAHLIRGNWERTVQMGNARSVRSIDRLSNGDDPKLVSKGPERVFTSSPKMLDRGEIWWGGPRSGEGKVRLEGESLVERQSVWEAIYLLELQSRGIPSEVPQALIEDREGRCELVVGRIENKGSLPMRVSRERSMELIKERTNLTPIDSSGFNSMRDQEGDERVIDVNRWLWRPLTDEYRSQLAEVIRRRL